MYTLVKLWKTQAHFLMSMKKSKEENIGKHKKSCCAVLKVAGLMAVAVRPKF